MVTPAISYIILSELLGPHICGSILVARGLSAGSQDNGVRCLEVSTQALPQRQLATFENLRIDLLCSEWEGGGGREGAEGERGERARVAKKG